MMESSISLTMRDAEGANISCRNKRWMVSMGGYEAYITVATYEKSYVDFLYDEPQKGAPSFMLMQEYGPFDLRICSSSADDGLEAFLRAIAIFMEL